MAIRVPFTLRRERHQNFVQDASGYMLTGGPEQQADAAWQFQWNGECVPEDWADQKGYVLDAPSVIHAGSIKNNGDFRDVSYVVRGVA